MKKNETVFQVINANQLHTIEGVQITEMEINNVFLRSNNLNRSNRSYCNQHKSKFSITLKGIFISSAEQLLLQRLIFKQRSVKILIKNKDFKVKSLFEVNRYEIMKEEDMVNYFILQLSCNDKLKYCTK